MSDSENVPIYVEQLCYTWSERGLSSVHAGFRVRAASPSLSEIFSDRMKSMDRYMRYVLPPGTDPYAITPDKAPVCLAFIRTDWQNEYIVVRKEYVGEDGVGRKGNFFVHLFALGPNFDTDAFSADSAIWLWGSDIWKTSETQLEAEFEQRGLGRRNVKMDVDVLGTLLEHTGLHAKFPLVRQYLPFIIEAYLTRNERHPLYIAASADMMEMIVYLIAGLVSALPRQLMKDLTFSTYEPDVTKARTEIVGTGWINVPGKEANPHVFSPQFRAQNLAINCATGEKSTLANHPLVTNNPLASQYAEYATACLVNKNLDTLYTLLDRAEDSAELTIDMFLRLYSETVTGVENLTTDDIEAYLSDPVQRSYLLRDAASRKQILTLAQRKSDWGTTRLLVLLHNLCDLGAKELAQVQKMERAKKKQALAPGKEQKNQEGPRRRGKTRTAQGEAEKERVLLSDVLRSLAEDAGAEVLSNMQAAKTSNVRVALDTIKTLLAIMESCFLPQQATTVWKSLLDQIRMSKDARGEEYTFFNSQWEAQALLLERWRDAFTAGSQEERDVLLLLNVPWGCLGEFLSRRLSAGHELWRTAILQRLAQDRPRPLTEQTAQYLGQNYSTQIHEFLGQSLQTKDTSLLSDVTSFVLLLCRMGYASQQQQQFVQLLERLLGRLIEVRLWSQAKELALMLLPRDYRGRDQYMQLVEDFLKQLFNGTPQDVNTGLALFDKLVDAGYPKRRLVPLLLDSPASNADLEGVLRRVYQTDEELADFFLSDGVRYLATSEQRRVMLKLFRELLPLEGKMQRMFVLLDAFVLLKAAEIENDTLTVIKEAQLNGVQLAAVLQKHGATYLQSYQSPLTSADYVVSAFTWLAEQHYSEMKTLLFALFTSKALPQQLEILLHVALPFMTLEDRRAFLNRYGTEANYVSFFHSSLLALHVFGDLVKKNALFPAEKMRLVLAWLRPSQDIAALIQNGYVQAVLQYMTMPSEQIEFLEKYGERYIAYHGYLPVILEYIETYIDNITADNFEKARFFVVLSSMYQQLPLSEETKQRIAYWQRVSSSKQIVEQFFEHPTLSEQVLNELVAALTYLNLPDTPKFTIKLTEIFFNLIRDSHALKSVLDNMGQVPKINYIQLFYALAELCGEKYAQIRELNLLRPYLIFILEITQEGQEYFLLTGLHRLLHHVQVTDLTTWKRLNDVVLPELTAQGAQRWQWYVEQLGLTEFLFPGANGEKSKPPSSRTQSIQLWLSNKWHWGKSSPGQAVPDAPQPSFQETPSPVVSPHDVQPLVRVMQQPSAPSVSPPPMPPYNLQPPDASLQQRAPSQPLREQRGGMPGSSPIPNQSYYNGMPPYAQGGNSPSGPFPNQYPNGYAPHGNEAMEQASPTPNPQELENMQRSQYPLHQSAQYSSQDPKPLVLGEPPNYQPQEKRYGFRLEEGNDKKKGKKNE